MLILRKAYLHASLRVVLVLVLHSVLLVPVSTLTGKVLLVSFDGFRWDYLDMISGLTNFERVAAEGSSAPYMNNTFTTLTFSTHYSMATGLYQESHGLVSNYMYDPVFQEDFWPGCPTCNDEKWWGGEPIWTTATRQGKKTGCVFWAGTEVPFNGLLPDFFLEYDISLPFEDRVDTVLKWFTDEEIDLGLVYFHQPDKAGHKYGPYSIEVEQQVRIVDGVLGYLLDGLQQYGLEEAVNVLIVSDHGLTNMSLDKVIEIPTFVDMTLVDKFVEVGAICHVFPTAGHLEDVFEALDGATPHMTVYKREDIPEHWHYSNNRRIGDILLVMDEGWSCSDDVNHKWNMHKGTHGYDNRLMSMKPIFLARGPDIKAGYEVEPFMSLDIYPLTAHLLGIKPAPNNGTLNIISNIIEGTDPITKAIISSAPSISNRTDLQITLLLTLLIWKFIL